MAGPVGGDNVGGAATGEATGLFPVLYKSSIVNSSSEKALRLGRTSSRSFQHESIKFVSGYSMVVNQNHDQFIELTVASVNPNHWATPFHTESHDLVGITIPGLIISGPSVDRILG